MFDDIEEMKHGTVHGRRTERKREYENLAYEVPREGWSIDQLFYIEGEHGRCSNSLEIFQTGDGSNNDSKAWYNEQGKAISALRQYDDSRISDIIMEEWRKK